MLIPLLRRRRTREVEDQVKRAISQLQKLRRNGVSAKNGRNLEREPNPSVRFRIRCGGGADNGTKTPFRVSRPKLVANFDVVLAAGLGCVNRKRVAQEE